MIEKMKQEDVQASEGMSESAACSKLAAWCSAAEHCRAEVQEKLRRWGVPAEVAERVVQRLVDEGFVDEVRYCRAFIHDKCRFAKWGRLKIAQALAQKRIPASVYAPWMDEVDEAAYEEGLRRLLQAKRKTTKARNAYELQGKLVRFALQRGFEMESVRRCLGDFDENQGDA